MGEWPRSPGLLAVPFLMEGCAAPGLVPVLSLRGEWPRCPGLVAVPSLMVGCAAPVGWWLCCPKFGAALPLWVGGCAILKWVNGLRCPCGSVVVLS